jgi:hypothetical protein
MQHKLVCAGALINNCTPRRFGVQIDKTIVKSTSARYNFERNLITHSVMTAGGKPHPKAKFTVEEDALLRRVVRQFGEADWEHVSNHMPHRNQRQCRDRWFYYLSPAVQSTPWTDDEDTLLLEKVRACGPKWVRISTFFPTRTDIQIKNRYLVLTRRKKRAAQGEAAVRRTTQLAPIQSLPFPFPLFSPGICDVIPPLLLHHGRQEAAPGTAPEIPGTRHPIVTPWDSFFT